MISVVIPAFNAGRFISRTIDSVLAQTYRDFELIVVDDGSQDNTAEIVQRYGPRVRYLYQENAGDGPARNAGIQAARGEWIAFLDHDDEWLPEKLERQMDLLDRNPDLRWCGGNYHKSYLDRQAPAGHPDLLQQNLAGRDHFENFFTAVARQGCTLITTTMIVHRSVFEQVGVFDSCWLLYADYDMWWRIAYRFPAIGYLPEPLATVHLDVLDAAARARRLTVKHGADDRKLVARHLRLAHEHDALAEFMPLAAKIVRKTVLTTVYYGFKHDARATIREFPNLLSLPLRLAAYLLTIAPDLSGSLLRTAAEFVRRLKRQRNVVRQWNYQAAGSAGDAQGEVLLEAEPAPAGAAQLGYSDQVFHQIAEGAEQQTPAPAETARVAAEDRDR